MFSLALGATISFPGLIAEALPVLAIASLCVLLLALVGYVIVLRRKNRVLAEQIQSLSRMQAAQPQVSDNQLTANYEKDRHAFENFDKTVRESKMYLRADVSRSTIIEETGLNKNRIAGLVRQFAGTNLSGYLNALRLEHAIKLIEENPILTIEAVAADSGFTSLRTFYRLFREKTGMSTTEYKATATR